MDDRSVALEQGSVTLVGAGPGDPELLTLRAVRALQSADVILIDDLVAPEILDFARREAKKMLVGKTASGPSCKQEEINSLMISLARAGKRVGITAQHVEAQRKWNAEAQDAHEGAGRHRHVVRFAQRQQHRRGKPERDRPERRRDPTDRHAGDKRRDAPHQDRTPTHKRPRPDQRDNQARGGHVWRDRAQAAEAPKRPYRKGGPMQPRFWRGMRGTISPCLRPIYIRPKRQIGVFKSGRAKTW